MEIESNKKIVMVAIDESECSHYALQWTLKNLRDSISNSPLIIFTSLPVADYSYIYAATLGATPPDLIKSVQENQRKAAAALLEKAKKICLEHGITAETVTEIGNPKEAVCEAVEKLNVQLLVVGSHGKGVLKRALLGSVSNYCVHNAKCPVLVVRKAV